MLKQVNNIIVNTKYIQSIEFKKLADKQYIDFILNKGSIFFEITNPINDSEVFEYMSKLNKHLESKDDKPIIF